uniref:Uncharacterized protein n=1 Tax=uncultured Thiotrichaceae bacterium TaxID=298394 RepID=A0A6S6T0A9_9GAMM|nr:MAG: Unknown protein [uncultured Thiotrichaceae bacterium]
MRLTALATTALLSYCLSGCSTMENQATSSVEPLIFKNKTINYEDGQQEFLEANGSAVLRKPNEILGGSWKRKAGNELCFRYDDDDRKREHCQRYNVKHGNIVDTKDGSVITLQEGDVGGLVKRLKSTAK